MRGLNLSKIGLRNTVLLLKWWWKFLKERNKKWLRFLEDKYGEDFIYGRTNNVHMSLMLKYIWKYRDDPKVKALISNENFKWKVGDGKSIRFWKDVWTESKALNDRFPRLFSFSSVLALVCLR